MTGGPDGVPRKPAFVATPNAERHLLESDDLRRRQLRSALVHGSTRVWRERTRVWPAVIAGVVMAAVIVAALAVYGAFQRQQRITQQQEQDRLRQQQRPAVTASVTPTSPAGG